MAMFLCDGAHTAAGTPCGAACIAAAASDELPNSRAEVMNSVIAAAVHRQNLGIIMDGCCSGICHNSGRHVIWKAPAACVGTADLLLVFVQIELQVAVVALGNRFWRFVGMIQIVLLLGQLQPELGSIALEPAQDHQHDAPDPQKADHGQLRRFGFQLGINEPDESHGNDHGDCVRAFPPRFGSRPIHHELVAFPQPNAAACQCAGVGARKTLGLEHPAERRRENAHVGRSR
mmetsp:Transcript_6471/g.19113  ORF Transcript_6471/g.19113 Transcript_6471/m.19113 type:complete len:232 (+) Transcript_6471:1489-2184(+)